jgi:hypothetical protein
MSIMPVADSILGWQEAIAAFAMISVAAFLVTWIVTDLGHVPRTPYVAILTLTTLALGAGYLAWSGTPLTDLVTAGWGWGVLAGLVAAGLAVLLVRRLPSGHRPRGPQLLGRLAWEGAVYGIAEAILLATLPVLAVWQATDALSWTEAGWAKVGSGALAIIASLFVIAVHHLGYREFRASRKKLLGALAVCGVQALAFLLTGNVLAPIVAHILLHAQLTLRGNEMPPATETHYERRVDAFRALAAPVSTQRPVTHR